VVGIKVRRDAVKRALYWDTAEPYHYIRFDDWDDDHLLLIAGGWAWDASSAPPAWVGECN
jgi:hypothetical protein